LLCVYSARKTEMWHHLQDCFFSFQDGLHPFLVISPSPHSFLLLC
jgi:hypothetical protein